MRGCGVLMMVVSNLRFDLAQWAGFAPVSHGFWAYFARITAGLFVLVAGVSLSLSHARAQRQSKAGFVRICRRGLRLLGWAGLVTLASWLVVRDQVVVFGVLHLLGVGSILAYPFLSHPRASFVAGLFLYGAGFLIRTVRVDFPWLVWLGLRPTHFQSADYLPLLPWFGLMLIGIGLGSVLFPQGTPRQGRTDLAAFFPFFALTCLGRHSLVIYFLHQPVLLGILFLVKQLSTGP